MEAQRKDGFFKRSWRNLRAAGAPRLVFTALMVVLAVLIARYSWSLPISDDAERAAYDYRSYLFAERVEPDPRVVILVYDEQTLIKARKRSPLDRGLLIKALRNIDVMGAKAIGIDILFDQPQDEDDELIATLRAMKTPTAIAYVEQESNADDIRFEQQQYLNQFIARLEGSKAFPASIMLDNAFGVTRRWPPVTENLPPTLSRAMLAASGEGYKTLPGYRGPLRYRLPAYEGEPVFTKLQIDLFADDEMAPLLADQIAGKYVLIGADLVDFDRVATTLSANTGEMIPGVEAHAEMIAQMLDRAAPRALSSLQLWMLALLIVLAAVLTALLEFRKWRALPLIALQLALIIGLPLLFASRGVDSYGVPAVGWLVGWGIAFGAVTSAARASGAAQRNFAQGALGKYLPREMAQEIIENPNLLALHGEKKPIYVLFSDLEGFTKMSHALEPEQVATLLNRYLERLSQVVLDHGGVIDKFVGDAVVAFWGAPIARPDDADRAARAGFAIWQAGEDFRREVAQMDPSLPPIGKTRVGLHYGEAVVGNFGGESRIQYTALGDAMNTAARLEAANKALDSSVMASREFAERTTLDWWRPMGRVILRGRAKPVDLMEPAPHFSEADRRALAAALALPRERREDAIAAVEAIVARNLGDKALENLLERLRTLREEEAYALG